MPSPPGTGPGTDAPSASLGGLPPELVSRIIADVLPEGFESLALSCRALYALCEPFRAHHNMLRAQFTTFYYRPFPREVPQDPLWQPLRHSCDLLQRIAAEPVVARYIRHADLSWDHWPPNRVLPPNMAEPDIDSDPVTALFASSTYLQRAGLDWRQYYRRIADDFLSGREERLYFSQHAAAFVLTLLPNARSLMLPRLWAPTDASSQLVRAVVGEARRRDSASLARVTRFDTGSRTGPRHLSLADTMPFLALPCVRSCQCPGAVATDTCPGDLLLASSFRALFDDSSKSPCSDTLENVYLPQADIDDVAIADLLRFAPRLRTLDLDRALPATDDAEDDVDDSEDAAPPPAWDVGAFLNLLERESGHRLERLAVSFAKGAIVPGAVSLRRGFPRLRELIVPLPAFEGTTVAPAIATAADEEEEGEATLPGLDDRLPGSLERLVLVSDDGSARDARTLAAMFRGFAARRAARPQQLPALQLVQVEMWDEEGDVHPEWEQACTAMRDEMTSAGLTLSTEMGEGTALWEGGDKWESAD